MKITKKLEELKYEIEDVLSDVVQSDGHIATNLANAMKYSLMAGGKRIRPILAIYAGLVCGGKKDLLLKVSSSIELLHTYSLIHDDLPSMDNSDWRRGRKTCHKVYGDDVATLAGDALLTDAWDMLISQCRSAQIDENVILDLIQILSQAIGSQGMVAGQILDLENENRKCDLDTLNKIHHYKTGKLFIGSLLLGWRLSSNDEDQKNALIAYGKSFGMAFQITDDILDVTGTTESLGKTAGLDETLNKSTFPSILGLDKSRSLAKEYVETGIKSLDVFEDSESKQLLVELLEYLLVRSF
ncbi:MAG: polyprenyl synthetase family protein [Candidatus Cloacimonetes bacterium]|nr:polyprenyl synthetase family protein [Candidatus Cloacimonadota bacterium]